MRSKIDISIVYVYFNTPKEITNSINSVIKTTKGLNIEIIIVDNASTKLLPADLKFKRRIKIIRNPTNVGFGAGCNIGFKHAKGEYILFLNTDTEVFPGAIQELLKSVKRKGVGIAGPKMVDQKGNTLPTISSFISFPQILIVYSFINTLYRNNPISEKFWLSNLDRDNEHEVDVLSGACLMIKKSTFKKVKGFDEQFFMYFEEQDLCLRINQLNLKAVYNPKAKIMHLIGRSLSDKRKIRKYFERSRYQYSKKHFGLVKAIISEFVLRFITSSNLIAIFIFFISLYINTYKQDQLMLFIGDAARDFLAARDMILTNVIPLVGIPSSVTWLHQGPISIYGIGLALLLFKFNPVAPAIFFGFIGAVTTLLLYFFALENFSKRTAIIASVLYAVSPMVVVNARMPYHTSLIPFFTILFFSFLIKSLKNAKYVPFVFLFFGLLLQVELSNIVVLIIIGILYYFFGIKFSKANILKATSAFCFGILPFILYDLVNGPTYIKFPLWIVNRIRLFFGLTFHNSSTISSLPNALFTIYQQISGIVLPHIHIVGLFIFLLSYLFLLFGNGKITNKKSHFTLLLWLTIPIISFLIHASPGTAYFALIYPATILSIALLFDVLILNNKFFILLLGFIVFLNISILFSNDFFVSTKSGSHPMPPSSYNFGNTWKLSDDVAREITKDANGRQFEIHGRDGFAIYRTSMDPYVYLAWYHGGKVVKNARLKYDVYQPGANVNSKNIIYSGKGGIVIRNE